MQDIEYIKKYGNKDKFEENLKRLDNGEPVQYIVGNVNFYGFTFKVDKRVLIPRFETEELIENTLKYIDKNKELKIIDLGTGSGCIAITLKKILPNSLVTAYDTSSDALEVALENAKLNKVNINFINQSMENIEGTYDLIISNPPYIAYDEEIEEIVKKNEPSSALYADNNGLYFYEVILKQASNHLNKNGVIAFEIGQTQAKDIIKLINQYLINWEYKVIKDLSGLDRIIIIKRNLTIRENNI